MPLLLAFATMGLNAQQLVDNPASGQDSEQDAWYRDISNSLIEEAQRHAKLQEVSHDLIARALALDPTNGDARYLYSRMLAPDQGQQTRREELLRQSLTLDLTVISRNDVLSELAELYIQQERYNEVLELLEEEWKRGNLAETLVPEVLPILGGSDSGVPRQYGENSPDKLKQIYLQAWLAEGPRWLATAYLQRLRTRFPIDPFLAHIDFLREERLSLAMLEWIESQMLAGKDVAPVMLLHTVRLAAGREQRRHLAQLYQNAGGTDPLAEIVLADTITDGDLQNDKLLWEYAYLWRQRDDDAFVVASEMTDIILELDEDRDGFWEERYGVNAGSLVLWEEDYGEDGIVDRRIEIEREQDRDGRSMGVTNVRFFVRDSLYSGERVLEIDFAPYPRVFSIVDFRRDGNDGNDGSEGNIRAVRWTPPVPPVFSLGLEEVFASAWSPFEDRIHLSGDPIERFRRQISSENAVQLDNSASETQQRVLRERGLLR